MGKRDWETSYLFRAVKFHHSKLKYPTSKLNVQHPRLIPELRPYQADAVKWMVYRETQNAQPDANCSLESEPGSSESSNSVEPCEVELTHSPKGGILADEMGLGKTVEVIACILANPRPETMDTSQSSDDEKPLSERLVTNVKGEQVVNKEANEEDSEIELAEDSSSPPSPEEDKNDDPDFEASIKGVKRKQEIDPNEATKRLKKNEDGTKPKRKKSELKEFCETWYEQKLLETNVNARRISEWELHKRQKVHCLCGNLEEKNLVRCTQCKHYLHARCIGVEINKKDRSWPVVCPQCWLQKDPIPSGATLIISPSSIMKQWVNEIAQHVANPGLKVLVYQGVRQQGYLQPHTLSEYDVVITTYEVIRSELVYVEGTQARTMRYAKRFYSPTCPLLNVMWWRLCLDEAQMVEGTTSKTAEMASRIAAVHRWAVTGTPVQKSLQDLYGLVLFLGVEPYSSSKVWERQIFWPYGRGDRDPLHNLFSILMWRSSKADVESQIQLPPQSQEIHWLNFSPVEEHFYRRTHGECAADFNERLFKCKEKPNTALSTLRLSTVNYILAPLLRLRQACSHPQAVRGSSLTAKKGTMSMHELLESLIKKTKAEAEDSLRAYIAALNGMAAMHIISNEWASAVEKYRDVLRIAEEYDSRLKVDSLQRIHTLYNLAEILEAKPITFEPTLRDSSLVKEAKELEEKYMKKCEANVDAAKRLASNHGAASIALEAEMAELDDNSWWVDLIHFTVEQGVEDDLISRVHDTLLDNRKSIPEMSSSSIINRVSTHQGIKRELLFWLENLEDSRKKSTKSLRELEVTDTLTLVNQAVDCHLRTSSMKSGKKICALCSCEAALKRYEGRLFDIRSKKQENEMVGDVLLLGQTKQGSWIPSEPERVLRVVWSLAKNKKAPLSAVETGTVFLKLMDTLRKEFKSLRLVWSRLNDQTAAKDELNMCKLRLRLRFPDEAVPSGSSTAHKPNRRKNKVEKQLSSNLTNRTENIHIIEPYEINSRVLQLQSDVIVSQSELRKKSGTLMYLKNLQEKDTANSNPDCCPICRTTLGDKWCVLQCGHCYCMDCMSELMENHRSTSENLQCAVCREKTPFSDISCVNLDNSNNEESDEIAVKGSHSTKVEAVVRRVLKLRSEDSTVKILIFATWDRVLDVLESGLSENGVLHCRLEGGYKNQIALQKFKDVQKEDPYTVLLLPLSMGAKGLNLTEATHVFLVEPILNPADELQAVGRVHRIGQTRPTTVHRFLINGTIEERMFSAMRTTRAEEWSGDSVTIGQLRDLFTVPTSKMNEPKERPSEVVQVEETSDTSGMEATCDFKDADAELTSGVATVSNTSIETDNRNSADLTDADGAPSDAGGTELLSNTTEHVASSHTGSSCITIETKNEAEQANQIDSAGVELDGNEDAPSRTEDNSPTNSFS